MACTIGKNLRQAVTHLAPLSVPSLETAGAPPLEVLQAGQVDETSPG
jgi:hypothetical protein